MKRQSILTLLLFMMVAASSLQAQSDSLIADEEDLVMPEIEESEPVEKDEVLEIYAVQKKASYKHGGDQGLRKFIAKNIQYPQMAKEADVQGRVIVEFVIDTDGKVIDVKTRGPKLGFGCEKEAIRVIKMTSGQWEPAELRDRPVKMRFMVPIMLKLY